MPKPKRSYFSFLNRGRDNFPTFDVAQSDIDGVFQDNVQGAPNRSQKATMAMLGISLDALINAGMTDADIAAMNFNSKPFRKAMAEYGMSPEATREVGGLLKALEENPSMEFATQLRDSIKGLDDPEMNQIISDQYFLKDGQLNQRGNRLAGSVFQDPAGKDFVTGGQQDFASMLRSRNLANAKNPFDPKPEGGSPLDAGKTADTVRERISLLNNPFTSASNAYFGERGRKTGDLLKKVGSGAFDIGLSPVGLGTGATFLGYKFFGGEDEEEPRKRRSLKDLRNIGEVNPAPPTPEAMKLTPLPQPQQQAAPTQQQQLMQELNNLGTQAELYRERQMRGFLQGVEDSRNQQQMLSNPQPMLRPTPRVRLNTYPIGEQ